MATYQATRLLHQAHAAERRAVDRAARGVLDGRAEAAGLTALVRDRIRSWLRLSAEVVCVPELPEGPGLVDERDWH